MDQSLESQQQNDTVVFDLAMSDDEILQLLRKPVSDSEKFWDSTKGLEKVRSDNMNLWLPNHWKGQDIYDYQEPYLYQDNRIFTSVETICAVVNSRIAQPLVMPAQDSVVSVQMSKDLQTTLFAHAEKFRTQDLFRIGVRNLLLKRVGFLKLRFDPNLGEHGDIVPEAVPPEDIIVDQDARYGDVPRFIAQKLRNKTGEEMIAMFPDAKQKVYELLGVTRRTNKGDLVAYKSQLGKKKDLLEIWFRYWDEDKQTYAGGLCWTDSNFQHALGKMKNPNWNYEEYTDGSCSNLLDFPAPPFIPINYLNDGTSYIDLTSMVEQAAPLQRILDRRGFQIMENAEQAGGGLVFNTMMITKEDISKLVGSPDERLGVKGDVNKAITRVAPPPLPNYVIEDKNDARMEIDNIFATHEVSRGADSGSKTLGQDELQTQQDYTRMDDIARAIERATAQYYRYLVQMMKVYYTEDHWFKATGEDGQFDHVVMRHDLIEDGIDVTVEAGSTMPINKKQQLTAAQTLAQMGMIDPLSLYEVISGAPMPSPKKMLERFLTFKTDPASFMESAKTEEFDRQAFMDIQILNAGEMPKPKDEVSPEYLKFMNNYMLGGDFNKQPDLIKQMYVEWLRMCQMQAQEQLQALMTQAPTPEDMNAQNQQSVEQAQTEQALMGAQQPPQPGKPGAPGARAQGAPKPMDLAAQLAAGKPQKPQPVM